VFVSSFNRLAYQFVDKFNFFSVPNITVILGTEGLGKSTFLEHLFRQNQNKVKNTILIDALKYTSKYSYAAYSGELSQFRKYFRSSKLLLFDNINLLQGKKKTIEELFHTLDTIIAQGGKTVITYEGDKFSFEFLGTRFASRLNSGLIIRLNQPTPEEIKNFINYYLDSCNQLNLDSLNPFNLFEPKFNLNYINLKEAVEAVDKVLKHSACQEDKLANKINTENFASKDLNMVQVINLVMPLLLRYYELESKDILGSSKKANHVQARYMLYNLIHEIFTKDYKKIAGYFQKRLSGFESRCQKYKAENIETFDTLCQKLYNQLNGPQ
jgi:chromosomal replication initiator protein